MARPHALPEQRRATDELMLGLRSALVHSPDHKHITHGGADLPRDQKKPKLDFWTWGSREKQKKCTCVAVGGWFLLGWFMRGPKITINNGEIFSTVEVCLQQRSSIFCSGTTENEIMNRNNAHSSLVIKGDFLFSLFNGVKLKTVKPFMTARRKTLFIY